ncbi:ParA family protein [bacterium]|nr:ParA family protein [bacterium]MBU1918203.1 ParA family protein [bacterium]
MGKITETIKDLIQAELGQNQQYAKGKKHAKIIAVCSQKGGVGKTTTAVNLGSALVKFFNKRVLLTDLDPQGHVEKSLSSIVEEGIDYSPMSEILMAKHGEILDGVVKTSDENLHITPGDKALYETEGQLASKLGREFILQNTFSMAKTHYDFIIIDCPPNLGNLTINALCAADYAVIPCEMSVLAFEGVNDLVDTLETIKTRLNKKLQVLGVLFTRVDGRNITMNELVETNMKKQFKGKIFRSKITVNTALNKAQLEGEPVFDFAPTSSGAVNYEALAKEIVKKVNPEKKVQRVS